MSAANGSGEQACAQFWARSQQLAALLDSNRGARASVKRGGMDIVVCWRDEAELGRRLGAFSRLMPHPAAIGSMATLPARAVGCQALTDGILQANLSLALLGVLVVVGLSAISRLIFWTSLAVTGTGAVGIALVDGRPPRFRLTHSITLHP